MIDHKYVENFSLHNVAYLVIGTAVFMGPWLMQDFFWDAVSSISTPKLFFVNAITVSVALLFFLYLTVSHSKIGKAFTASFRKILFSYITVFFMTCIILLIYSKISLTDPTSLFSRNILAAQFASFVGGITMDLLMNK